jgi:hypothetical protein
MSAVAPPGGKVIANEADPVLPKVVLTQVPVKVPANAEGVSVCCRVTAVDEKTPELSNKPKGRKPPPSVAAWIER